MQEFTVYTVVMTAVHDLILVIDFLTDNNCRWEFGAGHIQLRKERVCLRQRVTEQDNHKVYVCADCIVPSRVLAEVPVEITRQNLCAGLDFWATDPLEIIDRWWWWWHGHFSMRR